VFRTSSDDKTISWTRAETVKDFKGRLLKAYGKNPQLELDSHVIINCTKRRVLGDHENMGALYDSREFDLPYLASLEELNVPFVDPMVKVSYIEVYAEGNGPHRYEAWLMEGESVESFLARQRNTKRILCPEGKEWTHLILIVDGVREIVPTETILQGDFLNTALLNSWMLMTADGMKESEQMNGNRAPKAQPVEVLFMQPGFADQQHYLIPAPSQ